MTRLHGGTLAFSGVFSVLPTPFDGDGRVDKTGLQRVVESFLGARVNGFTALGVTSEVSRLNEAERALVLETVIGAVNGKVPVVVGTTAEGRDQCLQYSRYAKAAGASAVMVSPPRMPKLNSDAVVAHYKALAEAVDVPIVVQDYPPISGFAMEPPLLAKIAREIPLARTVKLEDPPTPHKLGKILSLCEGVEVGVFGGLGGVFLLEELMAGGAGAMTGFAYPEALVAIVGAWQRGERERAADLFYRYVPLMRFEFQEGIGMAIRKEVLRRRGVIQHAGVRAPGATLDPATSAQLTSVLQWTKAQGAAWISV